MFTQQRPMKLCVVSLTSPVSLSKMSNTCRSPQTYTHTHTFFIGNDIYTVYIYIFFWVIINELSE